MPDMSASLAMTHLVPLAEEINNDKVTPGVLGFIVFAALALGVWMLMKSMNRHMGKVDFEEAPDPSEATPATAGAKGAPNKV
ncbi:hypothetical protein N4G70_11635 [Streptomyces sp. ASQP_92]|uniref:hypothetical protein n=1 Tax=Streptomyces sp. ASQP_92 TaxID=2979116 RepID=UPI0021BF3CFC|nr:hypothetical protein [Streptomyces sp. ASQP_92]MCT9089521.1 hypothetical protein [Streptomyces sp. ASQP_92]